MEVIVQRMPAEDTERNIRTAAASHSEKKEEKGIPQHPEEMPSRCRTIFSGVPVRCRALQTLLISPVPIIFPKNSGKNRNSAADSLPEAEYRFPSPLCNLSAQMSVILICHPVSIHRLGTFSHLQSKTLLHGKK